MVVGLLLSAAVNVMIVEEILSQSYVSLSLLIAALGVVAAQLYKHQQQKKYRNKAIIPEAGKTHAGGIAATAAWFVVLLCWTASLALAVFCR
jgi:hypothetical protein